MVDTTPDISPDDELTPGDGSANGDGRPGRAATATAAGPCGAGRPPSRWPPASATSASASSSPRTATCWASTTRARPCLTTVKEAVDNALDACEEAGILPELWVHIERFEQDRYKVGVQDNGPGILRKQIPLIFGKLLYGSKFHRMRMSRGQQGIGISAGGHVRPADHRQAGQDHVEDLQAVRRPLLRNPDRHQAQPAGNPQRPRRRPGDSAQRRAAARPSRNTASSGSRATTAPA